MNKAPCQRSHGLRFKHGSVRSRSGFKAQPMRTMAGGLVHWCLGLNWVSDWKGTVKQKPQAWIVFLSFLLSLLSRYFCGPPVTTCLRACLYHTTNICLTHAVTGNKLGPCAA